MARPTLSATACLQGYRYPYRFLKGKRQDYAPVLLIGGAFQSMDALQRFAHWFSQRTDVILLDPPGTGRADCLPPEFGADFLSASVEQVLDLLGIDEVNAVGVSFGTAVAYNLAQRQPQRVANLVLLGTMSHVDAQIQAALETCTEALDRGDLQAFSDRCAKVLMSSRSDEIANFSRVQRILRSTTLRITASGIEHFRANASRLLLHRRLREGSPPQSRTLVFTGEHDTITTPDCCRAVAASIQDSCFALIKSADHLVALERPEVCTGLTDAFLRGFKVTRAPACRSIEHSPRRIERPRGSGARQETTRSISLRWSAKPTRRHGSRS